MLTLERTVYNGIRIPFPEISKRKILIVDDDDFCRGLLFEVLKDKHYCKVVSTAEQALNFLNKENFDLVLTDIKMPRKNGLELLSDIRKIDPQMMVIVMTGYAGIDSTVEALRLHAFDFLSKPVDCDTLCETVDRALMQVAINEETQFQEEKMREAMATRSNQVRILFDSMYQNYRKVLIEAAESLEVRGVRKTGHIQRKIAFALRLGVESGLRDADLMILEQAILIYESKKIGAPDEVLRNEHIFDVEEWKEIFHKETREIKSENDWKVFSIAQEVAAKIEKGESILEFEDEFESENNLDFLARIANFAESLCIELEEKWCERKDLDENLSLQIIHNEAKGFSDPKVLKAFIKIIKIEWLYLFANAEKYINEFEQRFRQVFYLAAVA